MSTPRSVSRQSNRDVLDRGFSILPVRYEMIEETINYVQNTSLRNEVMRTEKRAARAKTWIGMAFTTGVLLGIALGAWQLVPGPITASMRWIRQELEIRRPVSSATVNTGLPDNVTRKAMKYIADLARPEESTEDESPPQPQTPGP